MFGALFRRVCGVFGIQFRPQRKHFSEVTKTIEMLPVRKTRRWLAGGALHFVLVAAGLVFVAAFRLPRTPESLYIFGTLVMASIWAWIGPAFIWYYERYTLPILYRDCQRVFSDASERRKLSKLIFRKVTDVRYSKAIILTWIALVMVGFGLSEEFFSKIGISGPGDWAWWPLALGVLALGYYTSIGFCLAHKGSLLAKEIAEGRFEWNPYRGDRMYGLSFLGTFALTTNLLFFTGWLFVPFLFVIANQVGTVGRVAMWALIGCYFISTLAAFAYPVYALHRRVVAQKRDASGQYANVIASEVATIVKSERYDSLGRLEFYRQMQSDIQEIKEWPLGIDSVLTFAASQLVLPLIVAILAAAWTVDKVSP